MKPFIYILLIATMVIGLPLDAQAKKRRGSRESVTKTDREGVQAGEMDEATAQYLAQYLRAKKMRRGGAVLLGTGLGMVVAGAALVEIDAWGKIGVAGFACLGTGLGLSITGMFLLGFAKKVPKDATQGLAAVPTRGGGLKLVYQRAF
jgi:hypothetical protein